MDTTVLVALITGAVTALSTLGATALAAYRAARTERWRAEHALEVERTRHLFDRERRRDQELRSRFDDARRAVLRLGMSVRVVTHIRAEGPPRPGDEELGDLLRQARADSLDAVVAVERLRGVLPEGRRGPVDELRDATDRAFNHVQARTGQVGDALRIQKALDAGLRTVGESLFPVGERGAARADPTRRPEPG